MFSGCFLAESLIKYIKKDNIFVYWNMHKNHAKDPKNDVLDGWFDWYPFSSIGSGSLLSSPKNQK